MIQFVAAGWLVGLALQPAATHAQVRVVPRRANTQIGSPRAARAVDMFLKIDGIDGESTSKGHADWIHVLSWNWGGEDPSGNRRPPQHGGPGTLVVVKTVDKASPKLSEACNSGRSLGRVVVHSDAPSGTGYDEYVVDDVSVRGCSRNSLEGRATETLTLNFRKLESGDPDAPVIVGR